MAYLAKIFLYPIKSLDGVEVEKATILDRGSLKYDREFAFVDAQNKFVNGKRYPKIHLLRSEFFVEQRLVKLKFPGKNSEQVFHLDEERPALAAVFSDFLGFPVQLQQNTTMGFPDDTDSPGATIISTATLIEVASWFPGINVDEMRRRMRANIEIDGVPAFWEDKLFAASGETVSFTVGDVQFLAINPCQRCVVPTRDSYSGEVYPNFQKIFGQKRQATMPTYVNTAQFNHFYRLSVNTRVPVTETGKIITLGSSIEI
ncbi:MOSC domain-containing protein [Anabaena sp. UHCC 0187]|uniref:MOSC domain-containing protein n=1 Tax=Anabaena sp. UHCC 0187 TaxID=2590018 RepID=UPI00144750C8|nr:MOSC N-terminal beta barrel domain-containing protein [Anabaena sp. UHCC 0187]MDP5018378.1 MOSC N-terminal beta barrel domain-containing protein [Dolichospermum sp.]MTJ11017.1 MOSC domain-containing protein [Anabaena sp. UHCC 0187]